MKSEWVVSLKGIRIRAFHGMYEFEKEQGNNFMVDLEVTLAHPPDPSGQLESTVNYENLHKIVTEQMQITADLLEDVTRRLAEKILYDFENVSSVEVSVAKLNPPGLIDCEKAQVTLRLSR